MICVFFSFILNYEVEPENNITIKLYLVAQPLPSQYLMVFVPLTLGDFKRPSKHFLIIFAGKSSTHNSGQHHDDKWNWKLLFDKISTDVKQDDFFYKKSYETFFFIGIVIPYSKIRTPTV